MYDYLGHRNEKRKKRVFRVRKKLRGTSQKPRLSIHKTNRNIFAQVIDDDLGKTIISASTLNEQKSTTYSSKNKEFGKKIGALLAQKVKDSNINKLVIDRGRFKYHGVIAELVSCLREAGIQV